MDDEPLIIAVLKTALEASGYRVSTASSGMEALNRARSERFDLVLTDIRMPKGDGLELCRKLRELSVAPVVVFMSGYSDVSVSDALGLGAADFIKKPFDLDDLLKRLEALLNRRSKPH